MFVFVRKADSPMVQVFGPATPAECRAWMRVKGLHPHQVMIDPSHQIVSAADEPEYTGQTVISGRK